MNEEYNTEFFLVIDKEGFEPIILPERYEEEDIVNKCAESLSRFLYEGSVIKVMKDDNSSVTSIKEYPGTMKMEFNDGKQTN